MYIGSNLPALTAGRLLGENKFKASKDLEKLSSGLRINRAVDDAASISICEKMRSQIRGMDAGIKNAQDGISMLKVAEGGLEEVHSLLQRGQEFAIRSANGVNTQTERDALDAEFTELISEIDRISKNTEFSGIKVLSDKISPGMIGSNPENSKISLHIGANPGQTISFELKDMSSKALGLEHTNLSSQKSSSEAITNIEEAIGRVSSQRSAFGSSTNRLEHAIANLGVSSESTSSSESIIRDVDIAKVQMSLAKNNIIGQAAQSMLAQTNNLPQNTVDLLM